MTSDLQTEHAIETYKSLVQISVAGLTDERIAYR